MSLKAVDPTSGETIREHPADDPGAIERKVAAASEAFTPWRRTPLAERCELARAFASRLRHDAARCAALMTEEMGKPAREARGEVEKSATCFDHYAEHGPRYLESITIPSDAAESRVEHRPLGPVLAILPWNAPFWLMARACAPALVAGNVVLLKHDPHVPGCAEAIAEIASAAGLPEGVLQALFVEAGANEVSAGVLRDERVRAVSFTGSTRGGRSVGALAGELVKPAVLELGGSDPCIVLADADLERAADVAVLSRIINAGQSCIAAKRWIVEEAVHDRFLELAVERLERLKVGDPRDEETDIGPLARADLRDELHSQVTRTAEQGATLVLGGVMPEGPGFFYPPTLLAEVTQDMPAFREETFGPVAAVTRARDADEALALANDTPYGLGASVWSTRERGEALAAEIAAGQVSVNGIVKTDPRLPSGGVKCSGIGRELGPHGILELVNVQQVWIG